MNLTDYFKELNKQQLIKQAKNYNLYLSTQFSRLWIVKKIKESLLAEKYLTKLISQKLNREERELLKELIKSNSVNKNKFRKQAVEKIEKSLILVTKQEQILLPDELKDKLTQLLDINDQTNIDSSNDNLDSQIIEKEKKAPQIKITTTERLPFFYYLLFAINSLKEGNKTDLKDLVATINTSSFSEQELIELIFNYATKAEIITNDLKVSNNLAYWVKESEKKKLLSLIKIFFPTYSQVIRQIIAVLTKYPYKRSISNSFLRNELNIEPFSDSKKRLLSFFDLLEFKENKLFLSRNCWEIFNQQYQFIKPEIKSEIVIVSKKVSLSLLWFIIRNSQLIEIGDKLKFKPSQKDSFKKEYQKLIKNTAP